MPTCGNCRQEAEFYEHGGLFYCLECDTQSQVMRVLEKDDDYDARLDFSHAYSSASTVKKKRRLQDSEDAKSGDEEKSWWSCELYQAILKAQVKALIAMGFPAKLDEVVMQLWFRFVSQSQLAFCQRPKSPIKSPVKGRDKRKNTEKKYSLDNWLHSHEGENVKMKGESTSKRVGLLLWDSICFMYLGLRLLDQPVLLSDMIRWVREGHLPLRATPDILPDHISKNLTNDNIMKFCHPVLIFPDVTRVAVILNQLSTRLGLLPSSLSQTDINFTIARMVHTLNLPVELCCLTHQLYLLIQPSLGTTCREDAKREESNLPELQALAYIIVTLKLLFNLDDCTEHTMSKKSQNLQILFPEVGVCLFSWSVWVEAQKLRAQQLQEESIQDTGDIKKVHNMDGFVRQFNNFYKTEQVNKHLRLHKDRLNGRQDVLKEFQRPFHALQGDSSVAVSRGSAPSSFPMLGTVASLKVPDVSQNNFGSDIDQLLENDADLFASNIKWLPRDYLLHEDFSRHTLKHLTHFQELCEQHIVPPEYVKRILDAVEGKKGTKNDSKKEGSTIKKSSSTCKGKQSSRKRAGGATSRKDVDGESSQPGYASNKRFLETDEPMIGFTNRRNYVTYPSLAASRRLMLTFDHSMDCFHASMKWLLERCSKLSETNPRHLYYFVNKVEEVLFLK